MWVEITSPSENLYPRMYASGIIYENYFYIFFGFDDSKFMGFKSIIKLDIASYNPLWEVVLTINDPGKDSYSLSAFSENIYIFGGYSSDELFVDNHLALVNLKTQEYSILNKAYASPEGRFSGTMSVINTNFYLFGGKNSKKLFDDMWIFNSDLLYSESTNAAGEIPSARYEHSTYAEGDAIILWGGSDLRGLKNDLFIYNALTNYWTNIIPLSSAIPRPAKDACIVA